MEKNENIVAIKYIENLIRKSFFIPKYQRGYRWNTQNVSDLLDDMYEAFKSKRKYCLQPLVVKELEQEEDLLAIIKQADSICAIKELLSSQGTKFNVVDGQQRLTTILILLRVLNKEGTYYEIKYESRGNIFGQNKEENKNIDSFYANNTKTVIEDWLTKIKDEEFSSESFLNYILENIYFIWYQLNSEADEISSFIRLNKGKIPLTNSELIKALILNESNFDKASISTERAKIASKWDEIENTLQKDDFWYFIYNEKKDGAYKKPTKIDYLFEILKEKKRKTNETDNESTSSMHEEYRTFRYFYNICKKDKKYTEIWEEIKQKYNIIKEWYNSIEFYHYVGFLRNIDKSRNTDIGSLLEMWLDNNNKEEFLSNLKKMIKESISGIKKLSKEYETSESKKTDCKPLLLLFNIQTIINQNAKLLKSKKYHQGVFYKFPFGIFQKEKWDVEHIASSCDNNLDDAAEAKQFLEDLYIAGKLDEKKYNENMGKIGSNEWSKIKGELYEQLNDEKFSGENKNKICNFTLLDYRTNRSYGNSIFSTKRRHIIAKDKGKILEIKEGKIHEEEPNNNDDVAFVPPCTKNVFLKYYTPDPKDLRIDIWSEKDGENYISEIYNVLEEFGVTKE
ncbi:MAG: DUF262 domain-containing protein [Opitutales bacterium]|nr:DUF262 domain-containing protein [Opitutales bacterium]